MAAVESAGEVTAVLGGDFKELLKPPNCCFEEFVIVEKVDNSRFEKVGRTDLVSEPGSGNVRISYDIYLDVFDVCQRDRLHVIFLKRLNVRILRNNRYTFQLPISSSTTVG